jgi:tetratricopeptide (TPR) repeat protein
MPLAGSIRDRSRVPHAGYSEPRSCHSISVPALALKFLAISVVLLMLSLRLSAQTAQELLATGHVDQAVQSLNQQTGVAPSAEAYNLLCRAHFELEAWDSAIYACEKAVGLAPSNGLYHLWLGRSYGEKADHSTFISAPALARKCRVEFERAVDLSPDSWEARTDLAEFYLEAPGIVGGGKDKAHAQAEHLAQLNPAMAHWVKAGLAVKEKDNGLAEREYRAAIESSQGGARAWVNLAGFYRHLNQLDGMEKALRTLDSPSADAKNAEPHPLDHPAALVDGAGLLLRTGRNYPLAIRLVRRYLDSAMVEEAPAFKAHYVLGELLEKEGDRAGAAAQYRAALALAHSYRPAQDALKRAAR